MFVMQAVSMTLLNGVAVDVVGLLRVLLMEKMDRASSLEDAEGTTGVMWVSSHSIGC